MGENHFTSAPSPLYGVVLLMAGVAYCDPAAAHHRAHRAPDSLLKRPSAVTGRARPPLFSTLLAIICAFWSPRDLARDLRRWWP